MITKTNVQAIMTLSEEYHKYPHTRGILSQRDIELIRDALQLAERDELGLRNLRDTIVLYTRLTQDEMSAYVHMVDTELWDRNFIV